MLLKIQEHMYMYITLYKNILRKMVAKIKYLYQPNKIKGCICGAYVRLIKVRICVEYATFSAAYVYSELTVDVAYAELIRRCGNFQLHMRMFPICIRFHICVLHVFHIYSGCGRFYFPIFVKLLINQSHAAPVNQGRTEKVLRGGANTEENSLFG